MKKYIFVLLIFFLYGCDEVITIRSGEQSVKSGIVIEKIYVSPKSFGVEKIQETGKNTFVISQTKEMYLILLENKQNSKTGVIKERSIYSVPKPVFLEIQAGDQLDIESNREIKPVETQDSILGKNQIL